MNKKLDRETQEHKEFYDNFTDEDVCNYALTLFDSKFSLIKED